jgi:hypothetical protein
LDGLIFSSSDKQKPENDLSESFRKDEVNDVAISQERSHHVNIDDNGDAPMISPVSRKVSIF